MSPGIPAEGCPSTLAIPPKQVGGKGNWLEQTSFRCLGSSANKNISCLPRVWSLHEREWLPKTLELGWVPQLNCRAMVKERMWAQPKAGAKFPLAQRPALPPLPS